MLCLVAPVFQDEPVRADQEEQLPGIQYRPHPPVRFLPAPVPQIAAPREDHTL